jgi:hypothetical protein
MPVTPPPTGGYVAPVGGFQPAGAPAAPGNGFRPSGTTQPATPAPAARPEPLDLPLALGPNHPLAVKPEDGAYFICVRSYSRPHAPDPADPGLPAKTLAEGLANEIQQTHQAQVFLFEYVSEEKRAEAQARANARREAEEFRKQLDAFRQKSALNGMEFLEPDLRVKYQTFRFRDQIAVLLGGFRTEDEAVRALAKVKEWPAPKDTRLMDGGAITKPGPDGRPVIEKSFLNPYPQAMVVKNPAAPRPVATAADARTILDPFIVKLNEGRPYNLLKATRGAWTIGVKSYSTPVQYVSKDADAGAMRKPFFSKGGDVLAAGAEQAEVMAKALRAMRGPHGEPLNLEAFVLHTRTGSNVYVGQFDGPNDPALHETRRMLMNLKFATSRDERGQQMMGAPQSIFDEKSQLLPVPIPRP